MEISNNMFVCAVENERYGAEITDFLLTSICSKIEITNTILKAAARNWGGADVFKIILQRRPGIQVSEKLLLTAAASWKGGEDTMRMLLQKTRPIHFSLSFIDSAASNCYSGSNFIRILLTERGSELRSRKILFELPSIVFRAAAQYWPDGAEVVQLLLQEGNFKIVITTDVVEEVVRGFYGYRLMELLFQLKGEEV